jgi:Tol biopolymer transport system component
MRKRIFEGFIYVLGLFIAGICLYVLTTYRPSPADFSSLPGSGPFDSPQSFPVTPMRAVDEPDPIGRPDGTFIPPRPEGDYRTEQAIRNAAATATGPSPTPTVTPTPTSSPSPTACIVEPITLSEGSVPEGSLMVWSRCGELWKLDGSGVSVRLASLGMNVTPQISPDRQMIAFSLENKSRLIDLYVMPMAGGEARKVVDGEWLATIDPAEFQPPVRTVIRRHGWLPNSSGLAFGTWEDDRSEGVYMGKRLDHDDLWRVGLNGEGPARLLARELGGQFVFSPDGEKVALTRALGAERNRRINVAIANADGSDYRDLFDHTQLSSESDYTGLSRPQWTKDSRHLLVADPVSDAESGNGSEDIAYSFSPAAIIQLGLDGSSTLIAKGTQGSIEGRWEYNAAWSPDGDRVAYLEALPTALSATSTPDSGYPAPPTRAAPTPHARLVIAERDGSSRLELVEVSAVEGMRFEWSPDSRRLAFWERLYQGSGHEVVLPPVQIFGLDGSVFRTQQIRPSQLWWLDPDHLLVRHEDKFSLYSMNADSAAPLGSGHSESTDLEPISLMHGLDWIGMDVAPARD